MMKTLYFLFPGLMILKYLHDFGNHVEKKTKKTAPFTPTQTNIVCLPASAGTGTGTLVPSWSVTVLRGILMGVGRVLVLGGNKHCLRAREGVTGLEQEDKELQDTAQQTSPYQFS